MPTVRADQGQRPYDMNRQESVKHTGGKKTVGNKKKESFCNPGDRTSASDGAWEKAHLNQLPSDKTW